MGPKGVGILWWTGAGVQMKQEWMGAPSIFTDHWGSRCHWNHRKLEKRKSRPTLRLREGPKAADLTQEQEVSVDVGYSLGVTLETLAGSPHSVRDDSVAAGCRKQWNAVDEGFLYEGGCVANVYTGVNLLSGRGCPQRPPSLLTLLVMKWRCQPQMKASSGPRPRFRRPVGTWRSQWQDIKKKKKRIYRMWCIQVGWRNRKESVRVQILCQGNWGHSGDRDCKKQTDRKLEMPWVRRRSISLLRTVELSQSVRMQADLPFLHWVLRRNSYSSYLQDAHRLCSALWGRVGTVWIMECVPESLCQRGITCSYFPLLHRTSKQTHRYLLS